MYIRIVTFSLTVSREDYLAITEQVAPAFLAWPGLQAKYWLADEAAGRYGGVYVFDSKEAADSSRETDLFRGMEANAAFADLHVIEYDVLAAPTAVTSTASVDSAVA
jgi:hypothetical protein